MKLSKPREFWIYERLDRMYVCDFNQRGFVPEEGDIHVIFYDFHRETVERLETERDEYVTKYRQIKLANTEITRNDHVQFGKLMEERDSLKTKLEQSIVELIDVRSDLEQEKELHKGTLFMNQKHIEEIEELANKLSTQKELTKEREESIERWNQEVTKLRSELEQVKRQNLSVQQALDRSIEYREGLRSHADRLAELLVCDKDLDGGGSCKGVGTNRCDSCIARAEHKKFTSKQKMKE